MLDVERGATDGHPPVAGSMRWRVETVYLQSLRSDDGKAREDSEDEMITGKQYALIQGYSDEPEYFIAQVDELLLDGWQLYGGIAASPAGGFGYCMMQALYRTREDYLEADALKQREPSHG